MDNQYNAHDVINALNAHASSPLQKAKTSFFKTGRDQYGAHDCFIGVTVPAIRTVAKQFYSLAVIQLGILLASPINEIRLCALIIMVEQYKKGNRERQQTIYTLFMDHIAQVNNWNLVDTSAPFIVGAHLLHTSNKEILLQLACSSDLWKRRIAIISTLYFIRNNQYEWTVTIATLLLHDSHDLIHKAVGWMLREMGKKNSSLLFAFLNQHAHHMPRTMLRYAIEKLTSQQRHCYMQASGNITAKNS